jgi:hypothetical protein
VGQEHGFGEGQADVTTEEIHEEPAHDRQPMPGHENQQPGRDGVANPRVFGVAPHHRPTVGATAWRIKPFSDFGQSLTGHRQKSYSALRTYAREPH